MIQNIWIVEKDRGRRVFHKQYGTIDIDPDLFSAFLTGLYGFAEVELGEAGIDSISMGDLKWVYIYSRNLLFIIAGDKEDYVPHLKAKLNVIKNEFFAKFTIFNKDWQEAYKHTGFKNLQEQFYPIVDELVADWIQLAKVTDAAYYMDICEVCQHFLAIIRKIIASCGEERKNAILDILKMQIFDLIKGNNELSKIIIEDGFIDFLRVNVFMMPEDAGDILKQILITCFNTLRNELGFTNFQAMFRKKLIPYLKTDWKRIRSLDLDMLLIYLL